MNVSSVLIIDDDPTQVAVLSAYFKGIGTEKIIGATNAAKALQTLHENAFTFDLIVSDLQMPEMDGIEFLRHLSKVSYSGYLVIISGVKNDLLEHAARLARMHNLKILGQLGKPVFKPALDQIFLKEIAIETHQSVIAPEIEINDDLFSAALENGDIYPVFQPKIEVDSAQIHGAEVLARWKTADGQFISPIDFFAYAEAAGRAEELTFYLFNKAIKNIRTFLDTEPDHRFATNLSPSMISDLELPDKLSRCIGKYGLSLKNFSFEVTEDSILNLNPTTLEVLSRLRVYGFDVAIDDFGTGSSNIQTLRDFPYSELKIDRSFISNAISNEFSRQSVHAAVALASDRNMRVVAEGVENIASLNFIHACGIHQVQGYLISKPLVADEYLDFIRQNERGIDYKDLAIAS